MRNYSLVNLLLELYLVGVAKTRFQVFKNSAISAISGFFVTRVLPPNSSQEFSLEVAVIPNTIYEAMAATA